MAQGHGRRGVLRFGAGAAALAAVGAPAIVRAQAGMKLDLSTVWPETNFHTQNCKRFAEEVAKATGGAVQVTVHAGGSLGFKGPEQLRAVRDGLVPLADILNIQQVGDEPLLGAEGIPFLLKSSDELKSLHKHLRPEYEKVAARNNQKILYVVPWPNQYLHVKTKSDTLEGFKGQKIRVPDRNTLEMVNAIGMAGVLIPWGETIPALASGAVVGVTTSATSGVDGKFWEFLKFFYATNHAWSSQMVNIGLDSWKKIGADHQKAIEALAARLEPEFWAVSAANDAASSKRLVEGGMERIEPPAAMLAEMQKRCAPLLDAFIKRVPAAEPMLKAFLSEVKRA